MNSSHWASRLSISFGRRVPVFLQTEAAECGLTCLAMIAAWYGHETDVAGLRRRFKVSLKGMTLRHLIDIAGQLHLTCRSVRLELDELIDLRAPCILHWDLNHFVVLEKASRSEVQIVDPARGRRRIALPAASKHFTGVALELQPAASFLPKRERRKPSLAPLMWGLGGTRKRLLHILLLALALESLVLVSPFFVQWVVDGVIVSVDRDLLLLLALGFGVLTLIQAAISSARSWVILHASAYLSLSWSSSVFAHLLALPVTWFERRHVGDVLSRFGSVRTLQRTLTTSFVEAIIDGLMSLATLAVMLIYSTTLSSIVVACSVAYASLRWGTFGPLRRASEEQLVLAARANSLLMESVRAVVSIKLFNHEHARQARWMNATVDAANRELATERMTIAFRNAQSILAGVEHILVVYLGAVAVMEGGFSIGMLLAFVAYKTTFSSRVAALIEKAVQVRMLGLHRDRLGDIVLTPPENFDGGLDVPNAGGSTLEAIGVSFRYGDAEPWVLKDINVCIRPGESVAITGPSGCGKTTLLKILMGLLPPTEGEIHFGGLPISHVGVRQYRERIAAVLQDDQLLAGSIAENIALFDSHYDRTRVEACARIADIDDDVMAMPMRYETLVGDMGSALSGGQKQRILLARALYKRPDLLFLDEATSHLDVRKESVINEAIRTLRFTRVTVAHRPHTIASAGRVIALDGGRIKQDLRVSNAFAESFPRP